MRQKAQDDPLAAESEIELVRQLRWIAGRADAVTRLEGRDLGQVEDVADEHAVSCELDPRVVVDGEVAERMRGRFPRLDEDDPDDDESRCDGREAPHASASRATGAHCTEKAGLCSSARRYHARIARRSPAHPAAYPRWK